jgi:uncharacterized protein
MNFIGRKEELALLRTWNKKQSRLTVLYGRRRVGKTRLIDESFRGEKVIRFEGIEGQTSRESMLLFRSRMAKEFDMPELLEMSVSGWDSLLSILSRKLGPDPCIVVIDEFQWMAGERGNLVGYLKYAWDNLFLKNNRVHLILCGSVSSFMVKRVIRSKALYGRIDSEITVHPLGLPEIIAEMKIGRSINELIEMYMVTGGIPQYIQLFDWDKSAWLNIRNLCFSPNGFLVNEFERIFASHFGSNAHYRTIIKALARGSVTREGLKNRCGLDTGGRVSEYLDNLELAGFIDKFTSVDRPEGVRYARYRLADFYVLFYFRFIAPHRALIRSSSPDAPIARFLPDRLRYPWLGLAFEHICLHHHRRIAECLGFSAVNYSAGTWFSKNDGSPSAQIDLLFVRADKVITVCEMKYTQKTPGSEIIADIERKISAFPNKKRYSIENVLITSAPPAPALLAAGYFQRIITVEELFGSRA